MTPGFRLVTKRPDEPPIGFPLRAWRRCLGPVAEEHWLLSEGPGHRMCPGCKRKVLALSRTRSPIVLKPSPEWSEGE